MYPGDIWDSDVRVFDSVGAVEQYARDANNMIIDELPPQAAIRHVHSAANRMLRLLQRRFGHMLLSRIEPFDIYLHDLDMILRVDLQIAAAKALHATDELREHARYVMCSQVAWFTFTYGWGWAAMESSGMYRDRQASKGCNKIAFYLNVLGSEWFNFRGWQGLSRTTCFLWAKRDELFGRATDEMMQHFAILRDYWQTSRDAASGV